jgi:hypothetical protein
MSVVFSNLTPYITPVELTEAETGIDWASFPVRGASAATQLAAQMRVCWGVTEQMDEIAEQVLRASLVTETVRGPDWQLTVDNWTGEGILRTSRWPILGVVSGQWDAGNYPPQYQSIPSNRFLVDDISGYLAGVPTGAAARATNRINIAPGVVDWTGGRNGFRVQVSYVAGFPNCGVTTAATTGTKDWAVDDITGFGATYNVNNVRIYDGGQTESAVISSITPATIGAVSGPGTLHFVNTTVYGHAAGTRITAMPAIFQQAGLYLATRLARLRGATAFAVQRGGGQQLASKTLEELLIDAEEILGKYLQVIA